jgi:aspartyl-tRNA(Asn)/glutamyl-tRNA(Gln) amidotransferase subunit C
MQDDPVTPDEVRHVADLARIDLDESAVDRYVEQFAEILAAFEELDEVPDVELDEPVESSLRPDAPRPCLDREDALANAPETEDGYFKGPSVR